MNLYETTFILNPQADDATLDRQVKAIADLIGSNGGKLIHEDRMGTRRLAYEIKGLTQGYYTSLYFEAPSEVPRILDRHYRLEEPYIRHLTIVFEGDIDQVKEDRSERIPPEFGGRPVTRDAESSDSGSKPSAPAPRREAAAPDEGEAEDDGDVEAEDLDEAEVEENQEADDDSESEADAGDDYSEDDEL